MENKLNLKKFDILSRFMEQKEKSESDLFKREDSP